VAFLLISGGLLIALSAASLIRAVGTRRTAQESFTAQDIFIRCGSILGLLLGFIALAYALPKI
jgi:hypothetical protein